MDIFDYSHNTVLQVILSIVLLLLTYFGITFTYWYRRGIPFVKPAFPFGNFTALFTKTKCTTEIASELYFTLKRKTHKYGGLYFLQTPVFMPVDPALVKQILLSDFEYFSDRGVSYNENIDPLAMHLFNLDRVQWKHLRAKLTPTFTSGKIKMMFHTMAKCADDATNVCAKFQDSPLNINDLTISYTVDVIGSCAFGLECNSLQNPDEQFKAIAKRVINPSFFVGLKIFLSLMTPKAIKFGNFTIMEDTVIKFFLDVMKKTIDHRRSNNIEKKDFLQLLINMINEDELTANSKNGMKMTWKLATAQAFVFFAAGFETSSMTINLCLFELSQNQKIQDKVRDEIHQILKKNDGKLTYDGLASMTYLDMVVNETMRKYPPLGFLNRSTTKNYTIPGTNVVLEKGTKVLISLLGIHRDSEHYPEPELFDPERFNDENKANRTACTYMPFGDGHRICIGARFGQVQTKVCLANLLGNYRFSINSKTKLPLKFQPTSFVLSLGDPIYLDVQKISC